MVICFCKDEHHIENIPRIRIEDIPIERVSHTKILGVTLSNNFSWNAHVDSIINQASKMRYMLFQIKKAGVCQSDLVRIATNTPCRRICLPCVALWPAQVFIGQYRNGPE